MKKRQSTSNLNGYYLNYPKWGVKYIFWFVGLVMLFLSVNKIQMVFYDYFRPWIFVTIVSLMFCPNIKKILLTKYTIYMYVALSIMFIYFFIGHGDEKLSRTCYCFIRAIPLFYVGYSIVRYRRVVNSFLLLLVVLFAFSSLQDILNLGTVRMIDIDRGNWINASALSTGVNFDKYSFYQGLIYYFPSIVYVFILTLSLYETINSFFAKYVLLASHLLMIISVIFSAWTAPVVLLLAGSFLLIIALLVSKHKKVSHKILFCFGLFCIIALIVSYLGKVDTTSGLKAKNKITALASAIIIGEKGIEEFGGDRITLNKESWNSFLKNPVFGVGDVFNDNLIGGHSFLFDTLGAYGLLGAVPIFVMILRWFMAAWRNYRYGRGELTHIANLVFMILLILGNTFNPYLFGSSLDFIFFLGAGIVCGNNVIINNEKRMSFPKNQSSV